MTLRKITFDSSVRYIPKTDQIEGGFIKPNKRKNNSVPRKQNKKLSQNNKKFIKDSIGGGGFVQL